MAKNNEHLKLRLQCYLQARETTSAIPWLYTCLSTLDSKASALLRVNGIFLALVSGSMLFALREGTFALVGQGSSCVQVFMLIFNLTAFVLLLISSMLCHLVARIEWPFLGKSVLDLTADPVACNFTPECEALFEVVSRRTKYFQYAWWLSPAAIMLAATSLVIMIALLLK